MGTKVAEIRDLYDELVRQAEFYNDNGLSLSMIYPKLLDIGNSWMHENCDAEITIDGKEIYLDTLAIEAPDYVDLDTGRRVVVHLVINDEEYVPSYEDIDNTTDASRDSISDKFLDTVKDHFVKKYAGTNLTPYGKCMLSEDAKLIFTIQRYADAKDKVLEARINALEEEISILKNIISNNKED